MYSTEGDEIFGCFRCGSILHDVEVTDEESIGKCPDCREDGVVSFTQALDMLNIYHQREGSLFDGEE